MAISANKAAFSGEFQDSPRRIDFPLALEQRSGAYSSAGRATDF